MSTRRKPTTTEPSIVVLAEGMPQYPGVRGGEGPGGTRVIELGNILGNIYAPALGREAAKRTRHFCENHWWIRSMLSLKLSFFFSGMRVMGATKKQRDWLAKNRRMDKLRTFSGDIAREFCSMSNAAATWTDWSKAPWRQDIESIVSYGVFAGNRAMTICVPGQAGTAPEEASADWKKHWKSGGDVKLDPEKGDHFSVVTDGFSDKGLVQPSVMTALALFCTLEFLNRADWTASFSHGNIIRQVRKGFLLPGGSGNNNGSVEKSMSSAQRTKLKKEVGAKTGGQDWVTQHDLEVLFKYLDPQFFDPRKYEGVMKHLRTWAGSLAELQDDKPSQYMLTQARAEAAFMRERVAALVSEVLNDGNLLDRTGRPIGDLQIGWSDTQLWDSKMLLERWRFMVGQGAMSVTTLREEAGLDDTLEGDYLEEELTHPARHRPGFEPNQGILSGDGGDGRPQEKSNDTQTT